MIIHITYAVSYLMKRCSFVPHLLHLPRSLLGSLSVTKQSVSGGHSFKVKTKKMATSILTTLTHTVILGLYSFTIYYAFVVLYVPFVSEKFKKFDVGQLKYLTVWNLIFQGIFSKICLLNDLFGSNETNLDKKIPSIRRFKDFLYASIGFPMSMFVGSLFWTLWFIDRELVLPKAMDPYFPMWLNHLMHTLIVFTTLFEMIATSRNYPSRSQGFKALTGFLLAYFSWMHFVYYKSGVWPYPILEVLSWPLKIFFYLLLLLVVFGIYVAGETLNRAIWGSSTKSVEGSKKKK